MFSRRWLINYLLLVLIIVFTWIGMKYPIREDQKINRATLTGIAAQDIHDMRVETADGTIALRKEQGRWMLTEPLQWYANNVAAERLATLASTEPQSSLPRQEIDLSTLGLTIPKAVVTLNGKSVMFGDTNQIGSRRYLLVDANVYLASDIHYPFISQGLPALVDDRLLPAALTLQTLEFPQFTLTRSAAGWQSDNPADEADAVEQMVNNWQTRAARVKLYDASLTPLYRIDATLADNTRLAFFVLAIKPEIIIAHPDLGLQYRFPDHDYYDLLALERPDEG